MWHTDRSQPAHPVFDVNRRDMRKGSRSAPRNDKSLIPPVVPVAVGELPATWGMGLESREIWRTWGGRFPCTRVLIHIHHNLQYKNILPHIGRARTQLNARWPPGPTSHTHTHTSDGYSLDTASMESVFSSSVATDCRGTIGKHSQEGTAGGIRRGKGREQRKRSHTRRARRKNHSTPTNPQIQSKKWAGRERREWSKHQRLYPQWQEAPAWKVYSHAVERRTRQAKWKKSHRSSQIASTTPAAYGEDGEHGNWRGGRPREGHDRDTSPL
jgi:hypothetical protein